MKNLKFKAVLGVVFFVFLLFVFNAYLSFFQEEVNIINSKSIAWGVGWSNHNSTYSGSELGFVIDDSNGITVEISTESKADQGVEILVGSKKYFLQSSTDTNSQSFFISLDENKQNKVAIRHFCTYLYDPCGLTLKGIYTARRSNLLPYKLGKGVISILGDSISTIYGQDNYSFLLADSLGYQLHNASILGSTLTDVEESDSAINRYEKDFKNYPSDLIIIFIGTNDAANNVDPEGFRRDYSIIVEDVREWNPNAKIFLVGILKRDDVNEEILAEYDNIIKNISMEHEVRYLDTKSWLESQDFSDAIHPSIQSQKKLAKSFREAILRY